MALFLHKSYKKTPLSIFLTKSELTPKKLQKLVYYAYSWFIALNNENVNKIDSVLFDESPKAWIHGPVFKTLYNEYHSFTWHEVPKSKKKIKLRNNLKKKNK